MEDVRMLEQVESGREEKEKTSKETNLAPVYVSTLQSFETCGYFDASYKRRKPTEKKPSKIVKLSDGRNVKIIPTQEYGYPNAVDLDYKRALFRIIDEQAEWVERIHPDGTRTRHPQVSLPIRAQTKPFIRYAGRDPKPRERKILNEFLHRGRATTMLGEFEDPKTRKFSRADVALFAQVITKGEKTKDGLDSEYHLIWLTPFAMREYYFLRTRQEDITFHNQLAKPISKVLAPYLDSGWFASLSNGGRAYTKSYATLCEFLSIPVYKQISRIKQQLDPAHIELQELGYLESWEYIPRGKNDGYSVRWYPARKWFEDAKVRGSSFTPQSLPAKPEPTQQQLPLPTPTPEAEELARYFYKLFHGVENASPSPKETANAASLIKQHGLERARYVVDFSHRVAPETKYQPQTFSGIVSYTARAVADYDHAKEREARQQATAACTQCDDNGWKEKPDEHGGYAGLTRCTHQPLQPTEHVT
jgi:hypothetical protein